MGHDIKHALIYIVDDTWEEMHRKIADAMAVRRDRADKSHVASV